MNVYVTGQQGFIAKNLVSCIKNQTFVPDKTLMGPFGDKWHLTPNGEICVYKNSAEQFAYALKACKVDAVLHNAAVVGTDVVGLNPDEAVMSNVQGTYNIVKACNLANIPICYLGTTVIYDNVLYQNSIITEDSVKNPKTYYGIQKLAGEQIVKETCKTAWSIVRPLFTYGGLGDMNSLIAKSLYGFFTEKQVEMFLDPAKKKDYLHVSDFCHAVSAVLDNGWGQDWNVSQENPIPTGDVLEICKREYYKTSLSHDARKYLWYPKTDYLGNHILSSNKIREKLGWSPKHSLAHGIEATARWIARSVELDEDYNPLKYLEEAKSQNVDLKGFFPQ